MREYTDQELARRNKLTDIAEYMNIHLQGGIAHRALYDATMTKYVYDMSPVG